MPVFLKSYSGLYQWNQTNSKRCEAESAICLSHRHNAFLLHQKVLQICVLSAKGKRLFGFIF